MAKNMDLLDTNKDGFWSEADDFDALETTYNNAFHKWGDVERLFRHFIDDAEELKFITQQKQKLDAAASYASTSNYTRIPMPWMREQRGLKHRSFLLL
jgi:hypothetical protein